jgi:2'-5' RNA ligase
MPYTFVLTPPEDRKKKYVEASQTLYGSHQPSYLLTNDGTSSPHITIVQFECDEEKAKKVWDAMCQEMSKENFEPFPPPFVGVAFLDGTGNDENTRWVELSVKRGDENSPVMKVHHTALKVLESFELKPLNAYGNNFRPHLTLTRFVTPEEVKICPKNVYEKPGNFKLEFGLSDDKWQYAQTLGIFL